MALINKLDNVASVVVDSVTTLSNDVSTLLALAPIVLKSVNKLTAKVGDILTYTVTIQNLNLSAMTNVEFEDKLPSGCEYVTGTFKVNGTVATPTYSNNTLTNTISNIATLATTTITFDVNVVGGDDD